MHALRHGNRHFENSLQARLIEARQEAARLDTLGLGKCVELALRLHLEETGKTGIERRRIVDGEGDLAGLKPFREANPDDTRLEHLRPACLDRFASRCRRDRRHLKIIAVQPKASRRRLQLDVDFDKAAEMRLARIKIQTSPVSDRTGDARQAALRGDTGEFLGSGRLHRKRPGRTLGTARNRKAHGSKQANQAHRSLPCGCIVPA